ncbi:MAG: acetate kinase, partial [Methanosarcinales archaeon]|nr:acetate kinase [Methanosarcinales archaeon]
MTQITGWRLLISRLLKNKVFTVNCGSSSIKFGVYNVDDFVLVASGLLEKIGSAESRFQQKRLTAEGTYETREITGPVTDHWEGFEFIMKCNADDRIIEDDSELLGIGHRVVHGGELFHNPTLIDDEVIAAIRKLIPLAPLHNPHNLLGIEVARKRSPHVPQVAVFDTAFHQTLPPHAYHYALPHDLYTTHNVRRYGFHGTSHHYIAKKAAHYLGKPLEEVNLITLHLGNGASAAAIHKGICIDTSMGLTPLEGLVMGTRCGDLDPSVHFYLMRHTGMSAEEIETLLNFQSGLKGICGTNDMRIIQQQVEEGTERAILALEVFCYRIKKYIGAYISVIGKADAVVFTGGIGENSTLVREKACSGLDHLGISVDTQKNETASGNAYEIQKAGAALKVMVIE